MKALKLLLLGTLVAFGGWGYAEELAAAGSSEDELGFGEARKGWTFNSRPVRSSRVRQSFVRKQPSAKRQAAAKVQSEKPAEAKPAEAKPVETRPAETKPSEVKPMEAKPVVKETVVPDSLAKEEEFGQEVKTEELVANNGGGNWSITAGPVWRNRVKVRAEVADGSPADEMLWGKDAESPIGASLVGGFDIYHGDTWSFGLLLHFAGYWNMKFAMSADEEAMFGQGTGVQGGESGAAAGLGCASGRDLGSVTTRFRGDLYQIGMGPKVTWSPFAGWCDSLAWIDVYGNVEVLCNLLHSSFKANGDSSSDTDCRVGVGANLGICGNITDWLGIYGQVGYEWIDSSELSAGGVSAEVDYSSLVVSAGINCNF